MNVHIGRATLLIALLLVASGAVAQEEICKDHLQDDLASLEKLTIASAAAAERGEYAKERLAVEKQREKLAGYGSWALPAVMEQLAHRHVNVRRGAAILCHRIIEKANLPDRDLLDAFLQRMVDETDLKCRSNLSHVVRLLVEDLLTAPKPEEEPAAPRIVVEVGKPARFEVPGQEGVLFAELRVTEIVAPAKLRCSVRLVRKDGTDAGMVYLDGSKVAAWSGVKSDQEGGNLTFQTIQIEPGVPAPFAAVVVKFTATIVDSERVAFEVKSQVFT